MIGEGVHQLASSRVNGVKKSRSRNEQPPIVSIFAFPIICTALSGDSAEARKGRGHTRRALERVDPKLLAGRGIDGYQRAALGREIGDVIYYERAERVAYVIARFVCPGDLELIYIFAVDLLERRVVRTLRPA